MSDSPHPTDVRVGRLLRERRLELGISQERLGALLGVTYQQVQKYERGTNRIGSSRLHDLCGILGVRASYFFDEPAPAWAWPRRAATFEHDAPASAQAAPRSPGAARGLPADRRCRGAPPHPRADAHAGRLSQRHTGDSG